MLKIEKENSLKLSRQKQVFDRKMTIYYNLYELRSKVRREELGGSEGDGMEEAFYAFFKGECAICESIIQLKKKKEANSLWPSCYRVRSSYLILRMRLEPRRARIRAEKDSLLWIFSFIRAIVFFWLSSSVWPLFISLFLKQFFPYCSQIARNLGKSRISEKWNGSVSLNTRKFNNYFPNYWDFRKTGKPELLRLP